MKKFLFLLLFLPLQFLTGQESLKILDIIKSLECDNFDCFTPIASNHQYHLVKQESDSLVTRATYSANFSYSVSSNPELVASDSLLLLLESNLLTVTMTTASLGSIVRILPEINEELGFEEINVEYRKYSDNRTYKSKDFPNLVISLLYETAMQKGQEFEILKVEIKKTY